MPIYAWETDSLPQSEADEKIQDAEILDQRTQNVDVLD